MAAEAGQVTMNLEKDLLAEVGGLFGFPTQPQREIEDHATIPFVDFLEGRLVAVAMTLREIEIRLRVHVRSECRGIHGVEPIGPGFMRASSR